MNAALKTQIYSFPPRPHGLALASCYPGLGPGSALHIGKPMLMDGRNLRVCLLAAAGWAGLSQPVAPRPAVHRHLAQLNGIKNQRMVRGQCAGAGAGCLLNSKPQETFGPILGAPPAPAHTSPAQSINTLPI